MKDYSGSWLFLASDEKVLKLILNSDADENVFLFTDFLKFSDKDFNYKTIILISESNRSAVSMKKMFEDLYPESKGILLCCSNMKSWYNESIV